MHVHKSPKKSLIIFFSSFFVTTGLLESGLPNHYSIGAVGEWFYRIVLGINFDESSPGMERVVLVPRPGGSLKWVKGHYDSIRGRIESAWDRDEKGERTTFTFSIPPNVRAVATLPTREGCTITEHGNPLDDVNDVKVIQTGNELVTMEFGPGSYRFEITWPTGGNPQKTGAS